MKGWPKLAHEVTFALMDEVERLEPDSHVLLRARIFFDVADALGIKPSGRNLNAGGTSRREALANRIAERDAADAEVKRLYESGLSLLETGRRMGGHSSQWVTASLARTRTSPRPRGNHARAPDVERLERIRAMRADGKTLDEIGAAEHITRERVRQICNRAGIDTSLNLELTEEHKQAVREYLAGESLQMVAARYDVGTGAVRNWIFRAGHQPRRNKRDWSDDSKQRARQAAKLYREGKKGAEIAEALGLAKPEQVYRFLAIAGVAPNRNRGAGRGALKQ